MCGICGILSLDPSGASPIDPELIDRMTDSIAHRGPSDRGTWCGDRVMIGSRRLAVIDLSAAGRQPMANDDRTVHIVYNGEVYNFRELKERYRLEERGHRFHSRTDTEVLLHLYEELGSEMFRELNGMFAIAIWDSRRSELLLARDRYGIKPLFIQQDEASIRFGSEIKAILEDPRVPRRPDLQALHDFLTFDYIPGTQTAFEGIEELPPAHFMTVDANGHRHLRRYWDLEFRIDQGIDERTAILRARELLERALDRRLIADVPIGVLLSGGMDSSTVLALMSRRTDAPIHTYSVGFEESSFDELPHARVMSERYGTIHREVVVTADTVRELLLTHATFIDEPYADGSAIPTYCLCQLAAEEVVVVLSGEGGDEAFAGYETHAAYKASRWFSSVPRVLRDRIVRPIVNSLPVSDRKLSLEFRLKRFLGGQDLAPEDAHLWWRIVLTEAQKRDLYTERARAAFEARNPARHFRDAYRRAVAADDLSRILYIDSNVFLPDDLMIKNDRMSMAHSLEARVPFTDHELTGFMATVPSSVKLPWLDKKRILREAMRDLLPSQILRKKKVGLEMPYSRWFKKELRPELDEYLGRERLEASGLFSPEAVDRLRQEHTSGRADHGRALWGLLNYMVWLDLYLGGDGL